jgi:hypothetical protein
MLLKLAETLKSVRFIQMFLIAGLLSPGRTHLPADVTQAFYYLL